MRCKRLNWENEAQVCLIFGWFALKHKLTEVLRGSLFHCLLTKSIVRPSTAPGNLRLVERVGFFRYIRLGTEMPFTFHAKFDEAKIDFRMLRNSRENERISFSRLLARRVPPLVLRCPRRWRRRRGHGGRVAGAFYSVIFSNVRPWAVNFSLSVSAMFAVMSAR